MPRRSTAADKHAGVSNAAVLKATGRTWPEWLKALDALGARKLDHKSIAARIHKNHPEVGGWWEQMITVGYEQARGLRKPHQKTDGYAANASRTINVPIETLYAAWSNKRRRDRWLPDAPLEVTTSTASKSLRARWLANDTRLSVNFYSTDRTGSRVQIQHGRLPGARAAAQMKAFWTERLAALKAQLEEK